MSNFAYDAMTQEEYNHAIDSDLKLIDELLVDMRATSQTYAELEVQSSVTRKAFARLRFAWKSGEMKVITLGLANYFRET